MGKSNKWTYDLIYDYIKNNGAELLTTKEEFMSQMSLGLDARNVKLKITCKKCEFGILENIRFRTYIYKKHPQQICKSCSGGSDSHKISKEKFYIIKEELKSRDIKMLLEYNFFINTSMKVDCICLKCGHKWKPIFRDIYYAKKGCIICANKRIGKKTKKRWENLEYRYSLLSKIKKTLNTKKLLKKRSDISLKMWSNKEFKIKMSGENNSNWKGGITPIKRYLREQLAEWKKESTSICNYKCVITNTSMSDIHHVHSFNMILESFNKINKIDIKTIGEYEVLQLQAITKAFQIYHDSIGKGICLCKPIHRLFHKMYGNGDNTKYQLKEFVNRLELGEFNNFLVENNLELNIDYEVLNKLIEFNNIKVHNRIIT